MKRSIAALLILLALASAAHAFGLGLGNRFGRMGAGGHGSASSVPFIGPGNIVSGATAWYSIVRGYNTADASPAANVCTPSDATCADIPLVNGVATLPVSLSACNNTTNVCTVKTLYDKTGAGNNVTNTTIATRPTLSVPGSGNVCTVSTQFCMHFTGTQFLLSATFNGSANLIQPFSASVVGAINSKLSAHEGVYYSGFNAGGPTAFAASSTTDNVDLYAGTDFLAPAIWNGVWHAYQNVLAGASSKNTVDGAISTGSAGAQPLYSTFYLGGDGTFGDFLIGNIAEVGIWPVGFTSPQMVSLNNNQQAFYNPLAFEGSGASQPISSNSFGPSAFYNSSQTTTWLFWEGVSYISGAFTRTPFVSTYNKTTQTWAGPYVVGTLNALGASDPHGMPTAVQDAAGYVYAVYGGHGNANQTQIASTTGANNPATWASQGTIAQHCVFPNLYIFGSKLDIICATNGTSGGNQEALGWTQCSVSAGTVSGCTQQTSFFDAAGSSSNWLPPDFTLQVGSTVHMVFEYSAAGIGGAATNMFYAIWTPSTGQICNIGGSTCIAAASQPISLATAEASFQITTGTNLGAGQALVDGSGTIHLVYSNTSAGNSILVYQNNSGSGWSSPVTLYTYPASTNAAAGMAALRINSGGNLECYFSDGMAGTALSAGAANASGNVLLTTRIAGNWTATSTILAQQSGTYGADLPRAVVNADPGAAIQISESVENYASLIGGLRGYLYGEGGFIANPAGL